VNFARVLRTLFFVGFGFFSAVVLGLWDPGHSAYWLWAILLFVGPFVIFNATGGGKQFGFPEWIGMILVGGIGVLFFTLWRIWGGPVYPYHGFWHIAWLWLFWGYAGIGSWKFLGTLAAFFEPERYSKEYLKVLNE